MDKINELKNPAERDKTEEDTAERITTTEIIIRIIRIVVVQFNLAIISIRIEIEVRNRAVYVRYPSRDTGVRCFFVKLQNRQSRILSHSRCALIVLLNFIWKHSAFKGQNLHQISNT